jgi:thiamine biosynthesis lipoprotein
LDPLKKTITVTDDKLTFDVGAIAKGYAAERIAEALLADGIEGYLLNLGGNVRVVGARPDGEPWQVGVENPDRTAEEAYVAILDVTDGAVVISGTYQRYYEVDGVRYHHIIDPDTLMPEDRYRSVAVVAADSGMGDAFSTALFNLDYEDGLALVENTDGVEALWVMPDGSLRHSSGFERYINDNN